MVIANFGWDPLTVAVVVGALTAWLPAFFTHLWDDLALGESLNAALIVFLVFLGWGFTGYPLIWPLVFTMLAVAYGTNQAASNLLITLATITRNQGTKTSSTPAGLAWLPLHEKDTNNDHQ